MTFLEKLDAAVSQNNSLLCVGLDPDTAKLPAEVLAGDSPTLTFLQAVIDATANHVCAFKPNSAFFEARGAEGVTELRAICQYIQANYPAIPIILDFKRGDIGNTNNYYANFAFDYLNVDAVTIQPYLGQEAVQSYLDYADKGVIVLCRTSNAGAGEFQDLLVDGQKLYMKVAHNVAQNWNTNNNCLLVLGATAPDEMAQVRELVGDDMVFLVPGFGAQGGDAQAAVAAGANSKGRGLIINSSRDILYASNGEDYAVAAGLRAAVVKDEINGYR